MSNIIDLMPHLQKTERGWYDPEKNVFWKQYSISFQDDIGLHFTTSLWATSWTDAERRLGCLKDTAAIDGEIVWEES